MEAERYRDFYIGFETDRTESWLKQFAVYNFDTHVLADRGKPNQVEKYFKELRGEVSNAESTIEEQFEEHNFGQ